MLKNALENLLRPVAILGDVLFMLWVLYNGMDEGASGATPVQKVSYITFILLLLLNAYLLSRRGK